MEKHGLILFLALLCALSPSPAEADVSLCYQKKNGAIRHIPACLKNEQEKAEKKMQSTLEEQQQTAGAYESVFAGQNERLKKSQKAFMKYRTAECDYQSKEIDVRKLNAEDAQRQIEETRLSCMINLTEQRTEWLQVQNGK